MIKHWTGCGWEGVEPKEYKDSPGNWQGVTRHVLFDSDTADFQGRCFEVEPGGYTSWERHEHEHFVVVMRGKGKVRLGDEETEIGLMDAVRVGPQVPHRFSNLGAEPMLLLCVVDRERDRPVHLGNGGDGETS